VLFDEPERYYEPPDQRYYQQGDVVLAPTALVLADALEAGVAGAPGEVVQRVLWVDQHVGERVSHASAQAVLCPAMVLSHDCAMDKEFNRRYRDLRRAGRSKASAETEAAGDPTLDRLLAVAPVIPYQDAAPSAPEQLSRNEVVGYFPVCASPERAIDVGIVDLMLTTTVERDSIVDRLGVLTDSARATLRYALARFWVYRAPLLTFDVEEAVGKRIDAYRVESSGGLALILELDDGSELQLLQAASGEGVGGPERPALPEAE
jgi:hypothetical protein